MSGIALIWNRDGAPIDRRVLRSMVASMGHRSIDGWDAWISPAGDLALAHLHFWTTPEEVGECQPLEDGDVVVAWDGRLDNREALAHDLGLSPSEATSWSDARLVLRAYRRWGERLPEHLSGPFALVVADRSARRVLLARDAAGERSLAWHVASRHLLAASEPAALLEHPDVGASLDETWLAHFLAVRAPADGRTPFAGIRELGPAEAATVTAEAVGRRRHWEPAPWHGLRPTADAEWVAEFRERLDRAVERCLRAPTPPAVLMSGGLDSGSVAALAAPRVRATWDGTPLTVFSYVFDALVELDERWFMLPLVEQYGLRHVQFAADDCWALREARSMPRNASQPDGNAYRYLIERAYRTVHESGTRVLLTGWGGDHLFSGAEDWLADLLAMGHLREAWSETRTHAGNVGWRSVLTSQSVRQVARRIARLAGWRGRRARPLPAWLTPFARDLLARSEAESVASGIRRPAQYRSVLGARAASAAVSLGFYGHRHQLDIRHPFRDRELVELVLQLPGFHLYRRGYAKHVLRCAMDRRLPGRIQWRQAPTDISRLYWLGMRERERALLRDLVRAGEPLWSRYVRPDAVRKSMTAPDLQGTEALVAWQCASVGLWLR